jgi:hypothetical protein
MEVYMSEVNCNDKCNWSNSFSVNPLGTLDSVLECETCGKREHQTNRNRPPHLRHIETERYKNLKELFKARL